MLYNNNIIYMLCVEDVIWCENLKSNFLIMLNRKANRKSFMTVLTTNIAIHIQIYTNIFVA